MVVATGTRARKADEFFGTDGHQRRRSALESLGCRVVTALPFDPSAIEGCGAAKLCPMADAEQCANSEWHDGSKAAVPRTAYPGGVIAS